MIRLAAVVLLLLKVDQDTQDALLVLLPLACLAGGFWFGTVIGHEGLLFQFKNHLDSHFFSETPDAHCVFCRHERAPQRNYGVGGQA